MIDGSDGGRGVTFVLLGLFPPAPPGAQSFAQPQQHPVFRQKNMQEKIRQQIRRPAPIDANAACHGTKHVNVSSIFPA
tara:strand:+ start:606 stop:839 length:234 start_codon:yes stop_codon:yes gene_type:complete